MLRFREHYILKRMVICYEQPTGERFRLAAQITALLLLFISVCPTAHPHSDLQLQIDELTVQLEHEPGNVDLLLRRGDLQRRHENWDLARTDFKRVREIQPENETVDWFEGRLEVQSGHPSEGVRYLDRFLLTNPLQLIALQNRAQGYLLLDQPVLAAKDLQVVIRESDKPAPSIYSACALAFVEAGPGYFPAAMDVVLKGLLIFPTEIMLTGIATDLSLAQSDTETASGLLAQLPDSIQQLPQWQTRIALLDCQKGQNTSAAQRFTKVMEVSPKSRNTPDLLSEKWLARLASEPSAENCQAAALEILNSH